MKYYLTIDKSGTEDELTIFTPEGRPMLSVGFWDERDCDPGDESASQLKEDAALIVNALNAHKA